eukprot:180124-Prorocentrum_minimum.AAC.3
MDAEGGEVRDVRPDDLAGRFHHLEHQLEGREHHVLVAQLDGGGAHRYDGGNERRDLGVVIGVFHEVQQGLHRP